MAGVRTIRGRLYLEWWDPQRRQCVKRRWRGSRREGKARARELQAEVYRRQSDVEFGRPTNDVEVKPLIQAWHAHLMGRRSPATWLAAQHRRGKDSAAR